MPETPIMTNTLSLVIPAYNEAESLKRLLPEIIDYCRPRNWMIILVNDGSTDATRQELEKYQDCTSLKVIHHKLNRGYGGALKTGIAHAESEYLVTFDADGQHPITEIEALLAAQVKSDADLVIGSRKQQKPARVYRMIGKWLIRQITQFLLPIKIYDINSGFKMYRTQVVQRYLHLCPDSMAFSEIMTLLIVSESYLVIEHSVKTGERVAGKSTINTRTALETILEILNIIMLINPLRIFLPISFACILFGLVWGLPIIFMGRGVSVGSMLAIVTGLIFFFLGLVAEQLSLIRKEMLTHRPDDLTNH